MAEKNKANPVDEYRVQIAKEIISQTANIEGQIVCCIYNEPSLLYELNLTLNDFHTNTWRVYFEIARALVVDERKEVINDIEVGLYLNRHDKLKKEYTESGGYDVIDELKNYTERDNLDSYISTLNKWNAVLQLIKNGFVVTEADKKKFDDMSLDDIHDWYMLKFGKVFIDTDENIHKYNGYEGMKELVDKLDEGEGGGIPFHNCPLLNDETGGLMPGSITGIGGSSGAGKSTLAVNYIFPTVTQENLKALFIINEEDETKFKKEALIWYCNNDNNMQLKLKGKRITKKMLRKGNFDDDVKQALYDASEWYDSIKEKQNITIIPLEQYKACTVIKLLKQYTKMGWDIIVLDTLKESADSRDKEAWKSMMNDCVGFYDVIKHSNTAMVITYQLVKNRSRYLSSADIGVSKGILDVFSLNLFFRRPFQDEIEGKNVYLWQVGKNGSILEKGFEKDTDYMICFISKNRFGRSNIQIASEADFSVNRYQDYAYCTIPQDF